MLIDIIEEGQYHADEPRNKGDGGSQADCEALAGALEGGEAALQGSRQAR